MVRAVVFDLGETLVDETRHWSWWADELGVPKLTFFGTLGAIAERGDPHQDVFSLLAPHADLDALRARRAREGLDGFEADDVYPDAAPCIRTLRAAGVWVGIAANQPAWAAEAFSALGIRIDGIATSEAWGVAKPSPAFFARVIELAGVPPSDIAYVGDRLDNDVLPAHAAGMVSVLLRRGPWGHAHALRPEAAVADFVLDDLGGLFRALSGPSGVRS